MKYMNFDSIEEIDGYYHMAGDCYFCKTGTVDITVMTCSSTAICIDCGSEYRFSSMGTVEKIEKV